MKLQGIRLLGQPLDGYGNSTNSYFDGYSTSASVISAPFFLGQSRGYSLQINITGTCGGSIKLQASDDDVANRGAFQPDQHITTWNDIGSPKLTDGTFQTSQTFSNATTLIFQDPNCFYRWMRMVVTVSSGTAVITAKCQFKGVGS
jgi:hypothetical protein